VKKQKNVLKKDVVLDNVLYDLENSSIQCQILDTANFPHFIDNYSLKIHELHMVERGERKGRGRERGKRKGRGREDMWVGERGSFSFNAKFLILLISQISLITIP
jgi:hypothetical protein